MKVLSAVAWPYANGPRHLGHVAGFGVPSDVFSRYMRMAGHDVLMVSGSDEHGTPILVLADQAGRRPRASSSTRNHAVIASELTDLGCSYDLYTRTTTREPLRRRAGAVHPGAGRTATWSSRRRRARSRPSTGRTLPDRYIEGTCPICGYGEARGDQCDNCGNQLDATDLIDPRSRINGETPEFVETQHFLLDLPALADALREWLEEREASGTWRPNVIKFSLNILDDIRPRAMTRDIDWGIPVPLDGWRDNPDQAALRVVRRGRRLPLGVRRVGPPHRRPRALARVVERPRGACRTTSWARTTSPSTARSGRPSCSAYAGKGDRGGEPGVYGVLNLPDRGRVERVPHDGGRAVLHLARLRRSTCATSLERYGPDAHPLLHLRGRAGEPGRQLHLARVRAAQQLRARRRLGQPRQPHRGDDREELRRDPGGRAARAGRRGAAAPTVRGGLRHRRRPARAAPPEGRDRRGDARRRRGQRLRLAHRAVQAQGRRRARAARHGAAHARPVRVRPQHDAGAVPPARRQPGRTRCSAATARSCRCRGSRRSTASTTATRAAPTRSSPATTRRRRGGSRARSSSGRRSASPRRSSPSSTSRSSTRSSPAAAGRLTAVTVAAEPARRRPQPPTRCRSRSSTTTPTSTSAATATEVAVEDLDAGAARGAAVGVDRVVQVGCDLPGARFAVEAAERYAGVLGGRRAAPQRGAAAGGERGARRGLRRDRARSRRTRGSGSWGRPGSTTTAPARRACRRSRTRSAGTSTSPSGSDKALQIHDRDSHDDVLRILDEEGAPERTVLHCFSGDPRWRASASSAATTSRSRAP